MEVGRSGQLSFRHGVFVEVIHELLTTDGRFRSLNARAAQFLLDDTPVNHDRVATHLMQAGDYETAAEHHYQSNLWHRDRCDYENMRLTLYKSAQCLRKARVPRDDDQWLRISIFWVMMTRLLGELTEVLRRIDKLCDSMASYTDSHWRAFVFMERSRVATTLSKPEQSHPVSPERRWRWRNKTATSKFSVKFGSNSSIGYLRSNRYLKLSLSWNSSTRLVSTTCGRAMNTA